MNLGHSEYVVTAEEFGKISAGLIDGLLGFDETSEGTYISHISWIGKLVVDTLLFFFFLLKQLSILIKESK